MFTLILTLTIIAFVLFAVEILVIPGFGISGIAGIVCLAASVILTYSAYGITATLALLLISAILIGLMIWWLAHSKAVDKYSLHSTIDGTNATEAQLSVRVGDRGVAVTRLALIGNARIGGQLVEVKSSGEFLPEGTPIEVIAVGGAQLLVQRIAE